MRKARNICGTKAESSGQLPWIRQIHNMYGFIIALFIKRKKKTIKMYDNLEDNDWVKTNFTFYNFVDKGLKSLQNNSAVAL